MLWRAANHGGDARCDRVLRSSSGAGRLSAPLRRSDRDELPDNGTADYPSGATFSLEPTAHAISAVLIVVTMVALVIVGRVVRLDKLHAR